MLSQTQWTNIQEHCEKSYYVSIDNYNYYMCPGNTEACIGDTSSGLSSSNKVNTLNSVYKSFLLVNEGVSGEDVLVYGGYIPSLNFEREEFKGALRIYRMSDNFYSNDEQFISELKKIYISLLGSKINFVKYCKWRFSYEKSDIELHTKINYLYFHFLHWLFNWQAISNKVFE